MYFNEIWYNSMRPEYNQCAGYDWKVVMYPRIDWWWFVDVKRFQGWEWGTVELEKVESGQGWNVFYGIKVWGYFHLAWMKECVEIRYDRQRNLFGKNIVDEVRAIPENVCIEHDIPVGSMIGRFNKIKDEKRVFKCWFIMINKGIVHG